MTIYRVTLCPLSLRGATGAQPTSESLTQLSRVQSALHEISVSSVH